MNQPSRSADAIPAAPPSSSELLIRTLASDVELMGKSGGLASAGFVSTGTAPAVPASEPLPPAPDGDQRGRMSGKSLLIIALIVIGAAAVLVAAGFYLAPIFAGK